MRHNPATSHLVAISSVQRAYLLIWEDTGKSVGGWGVYCILPAGRPKLFNPTVCDNRWVGINTFLCVMYKFHHFCHNLKIRTVQIIKAQSTSTNSYLNLNQLRQWVNEPMIAIIFQTKQPNCLVSASRFLLCRLISNENNSVAVFMWHHLLHLLDVFGKT